MKQDLSAFGENCVYLKLVAVDELPDEVRDEAGDLDQLYAVHNQKGEQVALVASRDVGSTLAAQNNLQIVSLH